MRRRTIRPAAAVLLAAVATVLAACGDDDGGSDAGPVRADESGQLTVIAEDISFPSDTYRAPAGVVDFVYENEGNIVHTLVIGAVDGFKLTVSSNGDVDEGSVELDAGTYELFCDVPGHRPAGMEATLEVG